MWFCRSDPSIPSGKKACGVCASLRQFSPLTQLFLVTGRKRLVSSPYSWLLRLSSAFDCSEWGGDIVFSSAFSVSSIIQINNNIFCFFGALLYLWFSESPGCLVSQSPFPWSPIHALTPVSSLNQLPGISSTKGFEAIVIRVIFVVKPRSTASVLSWICL